MLKKNDMFGSIQFLNALKLQMPSTPQMRKANEKNAKNVTKRGQVRCNEVFIMCAANQQIYFT